MSKRQTAKRKAEIRRKLSRKQAAEYIGVQPDTLNKWASIGHPNIPYYRVGGKAVYDTEDLDAFLARNRIDAGGAAA